MRLTVSWLWRRDSCSNPDGMGTARPSSDSNLVLNIFLVMVDKRACLMCVADSRFLSLRTFCLSGSVMRASAPIWCNVQAFRIDFAHSDGRLQRAKICIYGSTLETTEFHWFFCIMNVLWPQRECDNMVSISALEHSLERNQAVWRRVCNHVHDPDISRRIEITKISLSKRRRPFQTFREELW